MKWPQIVVLSLMGIGLLSAIYMHGKEVKISFWLRFFSTAFMIFLLWKGEFF